MSTVDKKKIGLFDSGHGGLSVLKSLWDLKLNAEYYYLADLAFAPYGDLSEQKILERSRELTKTLIEQGVEMIVVACNTATAIAIDRLRAEFPAIPFVGVEPYLTAVERLGLDPQKEKLAVLVTPSMAASKRFQDLRARRDPHNTIQVHPCPNLARAIEECFTQEGWSKRPAPYYEAFKDLIPLQNQGLHYALLGCTHYPLIAEAIEKFLAVKTLSPSEAVAKRVVSILSFQSPAAQTTLYYAQTQNFSWQQKSWDSLWPASLK